MTYIRKKSCRLRRRAARRLKTVRKQLRKIDLSLSLEINFGVFKLKLTLAHRAS